MEYLYTYIYNKLEPNVGTVNIPYMEHLGIIYHYKGYVCQRLCQFNAVSIDYELQISDIAKSFKNAKTVLHRENYSSVSVLCVSFKFSINL